MTMGALSAFYIARQQQRSELWWALGTILTLVLAAHAYTACTVPSTRRPSSVDLATFVEQMADVEGATSARRCWNAHGLRLSCEHWPSRSLDRYIVKATYHVTSHLSTPTASRAERPGLAP
jgi:hypothetical protein